MIITSACGHLLEFKDRVLDFMPQCHISFAFVEKTGRMFLGAVLFQNFRASTYRHSEHGLRLDDHPASDFVEVSKGKEKQLKEPGPWK